MSTDRQQDADMDRLLRATLGREPAAAAGTCPDAAMVAAYVEGSVPEDERAGLEMHMASCGRCQDVLAAMDLEPLPSARFSAPADVPAGERRSWLWRGHLHWLIPVGAGALLVVYVASRPAIAPNFKPTDLASTQMAELRQAEPPAAEQPVAPPAASPAAPTREQGAASARSPEAASESTSGTATRAVPQSAPKPSTGERPGAASTVNIALAERPAPATQLAAAPTAVPAPAAAVVAPAPSAALAPATALAPAAAPAPAVAPAPPIASAPVAAQAVAVEVVAQQKRVVADQRALRTAATEIVEVSAPGGAIQWRVGAAGAIWRSADEGRTWYPQRSGVKTALLAAVAPSISTCWAVGAGGVVLLTDDGERWERRPFPEPTDLVAVEARSAHDATVTARDGRRFATADRGTTWVLQRQSP